MYGCMSGSTSFGLNEGNECIVMDIAIVRLLIESSSSLVPFVLLALLERRHRHRHRPPTLPRPSFFLSLSLDPSLFLSHSLRSLLSHPTKVLGISERATESRQLSTARRRNNCPLNLQSIGSSREIFQFN